MHSHSPYQPQIDAIATWPRSVTVITIMTIVTTPTRIQQIIMRSAIITASIASVFAILSSSPSSASPFLAPRHTHFIIQRNHHQQDQQHRPTCSFKRDFSLSTLASIAQRFVCLQCPDHKTTQRPQAMVKIQVARQKSKRLRLHRSRLSGSIIQSEVVQMTEATMVIAPIFFG